MSFSNTEEFFCYVDVDVQRLCCRKAKADMRYTTMLFMISLGASCHNIPIAALPNCVYRISANESTQIAFFSSLDMQHNVGSVGWLQLKSVIH